MKWCVERASGSVSTTIMCCANSVCMRTVCVCVCVLVGGVLHEGVCIYCKGGEGR